MRLFDRLRRRRGPRTARGASSADSEYLEKWAAHRTGVEAYVEPKTMMTETTVVLVAYDGEWTRRQVNGEDGARRLGKQLKVPIYDVARVGYPQRMRDYTARQRIRRDHQRREQFGD